MSSVSPEVSSILKHSSNSSLAHPEHQAIIEWAHAITKKFEEFSKRIDSLERACNVLIAHLPPLKK